jgi:hypothetical protein
VARNNIQRRAVGKNWTSKNRCNEICHSALEWNPQRGTGAPKFTVFAECGKSFAELRDDARYRHRWKLKTDGLWSWSNGVSKLKFGFWPAISKFDALCIFIFIYFLPGGKFTQKISKSEIRSSVWISFGTDNLKWTQGYKFLTH